MTARRRHGRIMVESVTNGEISSAVDSSGKYFVVGINSVPAHIKVYAVNSTTGELQATPAQVDDTLQPIQIVADAASGTFYVADGASNAIVRYKIDSAGSLMRVGWALAYFGPSQLGLVRETELPSTCQRMHTSAIELVIAFQRMQ